MTKFEEDMEFANSVLRIRNAMADKSILNTDGFNLFSHIRPERPEWVSMEYSIEWGNEFEVFGYIEKQGRTNFVSSGTFEFNVDDNKLLYMFCDNHGTLDLIPDTVINEEWYFQNSLLYDEDLLRALLAIYTLKANPCEYCEYKTLYLRLEYFDKIIRRMSCPYSRKI